MESNKLVDLSLFEGLSAEALDECAGKFQEIEVFSDHNVAREGDDAYAFFIVLEGQLEVHSEFKLIATLGPGDIFGELGVEQGAKRNAHVASRGRVRLAKMMTWDYKAMCERHPVVHDRIRAIAVARSAR